MLKFARNVIIVLILIVVAGMAYDKWQANDVIFETEINSFDRLKTEVFRQIAKFLP